MEEDEIKELLKDDELEEIHETTEPGNEVNIMQINSGISINALSGQFHPSTLHVTGHCVGKEVKILVDNGSNNNFMKSSIAAKLKLSQTSFSKFKVATGNGAYLHCNKKCEGVSLKIQGHVFITGLFILEIKGSYIVLGVQWLIELGTIMTYYRDLTMQFSYGGKEIKIQGENILGPNPLKSKSLNKMMMADSITEFHQLQVVNELVNQLNSSTPDANKTVLQQFQGVFEESKALPPVRVVDHRIPLDPGAKPVSVRPYSYPQFQKNEIERLVEEMMSIGVI